MQNPLDTKGGKKIAGIAFSVWLVAGAAVAALVVFILIGYFVNSL